MAQTCRDISLTGTGALSRCNGSLDKYRTPFAQLCRLIGRKRQRTKLPNRDIHSRGLFFHKRTSTGSADLVHHKIADFTILNRDIFGILPADFKDSIHLRINKCRCLCLRRDLILDRVSPHHPSQTFPPGTGDADRRKYNLSKPLPNTGKPRADCFFRVACRTQILEINDVSSLVSKDKICTGGTNINPQRTAICRYHAGCHRLRQICAFPQHQFRQRRSSPFQLLFSGLHDHLQNPAVHKILLKCRIFCNLLLACLLLAAPFECLLICMHSHTYGTGKSRQFRDHQFFF